MNELQIRLSADIKQFQAAMAQVESRLERAENILKKAQVSADRYRGALATLAGQFKRGEISQEQYNKGAEKLSSSLIKQEGIISNTTREVDRLNKEYKRMNTSSLVQGQNQLATSTDNLTDSLTGTNSISNSLSRTFRDLPGGITPLFENIRQLTGNFSNLAKTAGGVGPAISKTISSMITPANLALLAVSALTAAFTAYQMGAFDFMKSTEKAKKSLKELTDEINDAVSKTSIESANITALRKVIEDETLSREKRLKAVQRLQDKYPEIFRNADKEKLLNGQLTQSYALLTKAIIQRAEASLAEEQIPLLDKQKRAIDGQIDSLKEQLKIQEQILSGQRAPEIIRGAANVDALGIAAGQAERLKSEIDALETTSKSLQINIDGYTQSIIDYQGEFVNLLEPINDGLDKSTKASKEALEVWTDTQWQEAIDNQEALFRALQKIQVPKTVNQDDPFGISALLGAEAPIKEFAEELETVQTKVTDNTAQIASAFSGMSFQVSEALGISNRNLRAFVGTVISNAPKIISAIMAQAKAAQAAAVITNSANLAQAKGNAVVSATAAAKGLGPVGLALLPVFIAGALALVAGAFGKGGGGKGGGGGASASTGRTFSNAPSTGGLPQPSNNSFPPNTPFSQSGNFQVDINLKGPEDLLFFIENASITKGQR